MKYFKISILSISLTVIAIKPFSGWTCVLFPKYPSLDIKPSWQEENLPSNNSQTKKQKFSYCTINPQREIPCVSGQTYTAYEEAQSLFQYFLDELAQDAFITHEKQHEKVQEFKTLAESLSQEVASILTSLLLEETRVRIIDILRNAALDECEIEAHLTDNKEALLRVQNMDVETARQMLFFVAELKIHRQYIYEFGVALGCPEKQLLRHDLCKLSKEQFEAYVCYFRGGRQEIDKLAFLAAWEIHQHEEHHLESYSKEECHFDSFSEEQLRNNMLEATADMLAATKQRGGGPLTDWLVNVFPKSNPHPRLIPFLENGLRKAHVFYLESTKNSDSDSIFKCLPCWNSEVEEVFSKLTISSKDESRDQK
jgi:hypothetical protein